MTTTYSSVVCAGKPKEKNCWGQIKPSQQIYITHQTTNTYINRSHILTPNHKLHSLNMTRRKWTTDEQETWLEQRKAAFIEANQKKTTAKDFFPIVTKEFREKWPTPPVTQQEVDDAGSTELAA
jgi:hypothetical protein